MKHASAFLLSFAVFLLGGCDTASVGTEDPYAELRAQGIYCHEQAELCSTDFTHEWMHGEGECSLAITANTSSRQNWAWSSLASCAYDLCADEEDPESCARSALSDEHGPCGAARYSCSQLSWL